MNLHLVDWIVLVVFVLFLAAIVLYTKKFTSSVSDFLAANRKAGRYLLTTAQGMSDLAAVGIIGLYENHYQTGFAGSWWILMWGIATICISLSGWVTYRYRATRVLTLPQLFEVRYSKNFRKFAGVVMFSAGALNCGIIPAINARFMIYFCGFPLHFDFLGITFSTFSVIMFIMVAAAIYFATSGGQVTIMVSDLFQGLIVNLTMATLIICIIWKFGWVNIFDTLKTAPENASMIHPFRQEELPDFGWTFFVMVVFMRFYNRNVWQNDAGYLGAARTPHEARMAKILSEWRAFVFFLMCAIVPVAAYVLMHNPLFITEAAEVNQIIDGISQPQIREQMLVPVALTRILPIGVMGMFLIMMVGAAVSTDDSVYHSWGSVFVQDVVASFSKKPLSRERRMKLLRFSITGVGVFAFFWSMYFPLKEYIAMYFHITGAIFFGGAGAALIGGLYWKKGTTAGAWTGMIIGSTLAVGGIVLRVVWEKIPWLVSLSPELPLNGTQMMFSTCLTAIACYTIVSLLTCRKNYNMDKLLHRGKYAIAGEHEQKSQHPFRLWRLIGITNEFSLSDKVIYIAQIIWMIGWAAVFFGGTIYNLSHDVSEEAWISWWKFFIITGAVVAVITVIWFSIGGVIDLKDLFKSLSTEKIDLTDDGTVIKEGNE